MEDFELVLEDIELSSHKIEYYDIEINSPITEEDIRYAQLEDIIFRENNNEFNGRKNIPLFRDQNLSRNSFN
jgi:hypothetical protein